MTGVEVALALTAVSAAVGVAGAISSGNAQRAAGNRQAAIDNRNAELAGQDRIQAIQTAQIAAGDKRREDRRHLASMRASFGSSGLELAGSPLDVLADSSTEMALDERRVEYDGQVQGRSAALRMLGLGESADTARAAGQNARNASLINAGSDVLSTGASIANYGSQNKVWK